MISEQTLNLLRSAKKIALAIADEASLDQMGAALGLLNFLITQNKKVDFLFTNDLPPQFSFLASYFPEESPAHAKTDDLRDFIISLDAKKHGIEEIRYEKNNDTLSIVLGVKQSPSIADITIKSADDYDLVVSLGIPKQEMITAKTKAGALRITRAPMFLISRENPKETDADTALTDATKSSWCELVWDLIAAINDKKEITETIATPLLAGLFFATENLQSPNATVASAKLASLLVTYGAKQELINEHLKTKTPFNVMQLWARTLSRSRLDDTTGILWSFIPAEDFLKTGSTSKDLSLIFLHMEQLVSSPAGFLYVFENPHKNHIRAILKSKDNGILARAAEKEAGDLSPGALVFHKSFSSFTEAEEHLRTLLTKVI